MSYRKPIIAVSATALDKSGALTILKQFVMSASKDNRFEYVCFIPEKLYLPEFSNVKYIEIPKMSWWKRIYWDSFGFRNYLDGINVSPAKVISLQNTSLNINVAQIIYLHQPLPFSSVKWNPLKRQQIKFYLYNKFYHFFISMYVRDDTSFVVQTKWMKGALCSKLKIESEKINVIKPNLSLPLDLASIDEIDEIDENRTIKLLYPATPLFYKNHDVILKALKLIKDQGDNANVIFQVTFQAEDYKSFSTSVKNLELDSNIEYLGVVSYEKLLVHYKLAEAVLFPSYIETFGLPLAEGATLKKKVICSDLEYARDVLEGYPGAEYVDYNDPRAWASAIKKTMLNSGKNNIIDGDFKSHDNSSWKDFFELI